MPPKSKRQRQLESSLERARAAKMSHLSSDEASNTPDIEVRAEPEGLEDLLNSSVEALDTENEEVDPSFDLDESMKSDTAHMTDTFCEDWVTHLDWEDRASLGLFLHFQLSSLLGMGETESAELAGLMIGKCEKTIRNWKSK